MNRKKWGKKVFLKKFKKFLKSSEKHFTKLK